MGEMKSFDEPMPQVGIFWYDQANKVFLDVCKEEITPKRIEEAAEQGRFRIDYNRPHQVEIKDGLCGRVAWNIDKFIVFVGQWAKPIEPQLYEMIEKEFALPYFEFVYDEHWDLGHGLNGDL